MVFQFVRWVVGAGAAVVSIVPVFAADATLPQVEPTQVPEQATTVERGVDDLRELAIDYSRAFGVNERHVLAIVTCETGGTWDPKIQSQIMQPYGQEDSWGLAQIHLPDHPEITREQAQDPDFALYFIAKEISEGRMWKWSCAKKLGLL